MDAPQMLAARYWIGQCLDMEEALGRHLTDARERLGIARAPVTTIIERNFGGTPLASRCAEVLGRSPPVNHFCPSFPKVGIFTNADAKERYRIVLNEALKSDRVTFHALFGSAQGATATRTAIVEQLGRYRYVTRAGGRALSGKGHAPSENDDLAVALQMAIFWGFTVIDHGGRGCCYAKV